VAVAETVNGGVLMGTLGSAGNVNSLWLLRRQGGEIPSTAAMRGQGQLMQSWNSVRDALPALPTGVQVVYGLGEEYTPVSLDTYIV
jgi:hypothetical protein